MSLHRLFPYFAFAGLLAAADKPIDFNRDVRPILSDNCFACHGPDDKHRMANLRLDTADGLTRVKDRLVARVSPGAKPQQMPPPSSGKQLTDPQIATIRKWVEQGAKWEQHWAYSPIERKPAPPVKNEAWVRNEIDRFVLARLEREGLKPSPEADRTTLLRRLSFDLTGLPPTTAEIQAFLTDKSPDAYDKQVDRLLASPHYGERMAMQWLDLARYADTHGYHIDSHRDMWHWRNWVIDAYNRNMPFDRFTVEQLAGDLLPDATPSQILATGFNRNHMINFEGGAIPEEYQTEYVVDRVDTTSTVWMGTTLGCARCHDHKYDPIAQKDYYRFFAFFNTIAEKGLDGRAGNAEPMLPLPTESQAAEEARLKQEIQEHEEALPKEKVTALIGDWQKTRLDTLPKATREGLLAHYEMDGNLADTSGRYQHGRTLRGEVLFTPAPVDRAGTFGGETAVQLGDGGFDRSAAFAMAFWVRTSGRDAMPLLEKGKDFQIGFADTHKVPDLKRAAPMLFRLGSLRARTRQEFIQRQWYHVAVNYDGALHLFVDGRPADLEITQAGGGAFASDAPLEIAGYKGDLDDLRIYGRILAEPDVATLYLHEPVRAILLAQESKRTKEQNQRLRDYYLTRDAPEPFRRTYVELTALKERRAALEKRIDSTMVMGEMKKPRETFVLGRGDYRNHGEKVTPAVPAMLPPLPKDAPPNRLGLAMWLVSPTHPLTSRVAVNRYWQMYFGIGLVKTSEDFGSQGDMPVYPGLLDWLASEFMRTKWDVKAMQRLIVTSATYRQSSKVSPELLERDPENRMLAHGPRFRLPAEVVRDNALAVSGLLNPVIGGPSVFPYQPAGLWEEMAYGDVYSAQEYVQSHGQDLYRRSMYNFWKRTVPPASLSAFDAPDREKCTARRLVTNTPLQALVLLNDPTYVEASRALAQRAIREGGRDSRSRLRFAFRQATARVPSAKETEVLLALERKKLADYRKNIEAAQKLITVGESKPDPKIEVEELAAWTTVASVILNLDETITKE